MFARRPTSPPFIHSFIHSQRGKSATKRSKAEKGKSGEGQRGDGGGSPLPPELSPASSPLASLLLLPRLLLRPSRLSLSVPLPLLLILTLVGLAANSGVASARAADGCARRRRSRRDEAVGTHAGDRRRGRRTGGRRPRRRRRCRRRATADGWARSRLIRNTDLARGARSLGQDAGRSHPTDNALRGRHDSRLRGCHRMADAGGSAGAGVRNGNLVG